MADNYTKYTIEWEATANTAKLDKELSKLLDKFGLVEKIADNQITITMNENIQGFDKIKSLLEPLFQTIGLHFSVDKKEIDNINKIIEDTKDRLSSLSDIRKILNQRSGKAIGNNALTQFIADLNSAITDTFDSSIKLDKSTKNFFSKIGNTNFGTFNTKQLEGVRNATKDIISNLTAKGIPESTEKLEALVKAIDLYVQSSEKLGADKNYGKSLDILNAEKITKDGQTIDSVIKNVRDKLHALAEESRTDLTKYTTEQAIIAQRTKFAETVAENEDSLKQFQEIINSFIEKFTAFANGDKTAFDKPIQATKKIADNLKEAKESIEAIDQIEQKSQSGLTKRGQALLSQTKEDLKTDAAINNSVSGKNIAITGTNTITGNTGNENINIKDSNIQITDTSGLQNLTADNLNTLEKAREDLADSSKKVSSAEKDIQKSIKETSDVANNSVSVLEQRFNATQQSVTNLEFVLQGLLQLVQSLQSAMDSHDQKKPLDVISNTSMIPNQTLENINVEDTKKEIGLINASLKELIQRITITIPQSLGLMSASFKDYAILSVQNLDPLSQKIQDLTIDLSTLKQNLSGEVKNSDRDRRDIDTLLSNLEKSVEKTNTDINIKDTSSDLIKLINSISSSIGKAETKIADFPESFQANLVKAKPDLEIFLNIVKEISDKVQELKDAGVVFKSITYNNKTKQTDTSEIDKQIEFFKQRQELLDKLYKFYNEHNGAEYTFAGHLGDQGLYNDQLKNLHTDLLKLAEDIEKTADGSLDKYDKKLQSISKSILSVEALEAEYAKNRSNANGLLKTIKQLKASDDLTIGKSILPDAEVQNIISKINKINEQLLDPSLTTQKFEALRNELDKVIGDTNSRIIQAKAKAEKIQQVSSLIDYLDLNLDGYFKDLIPESSYKKIRQKLKEVSEELLNPTTTEKRIDAIHKDLSRLIEDTKDQAQEALNSLNAKRQLVYASIAARNSEMGIYKPNYAGDNISPTTEMQRIASEMSQYYNKARVANSEKELDQLEKAHKELGDQLAREIEKENELIQKRIELLNQIKQFKESSSAFGYFNDENDSDALKKSREELVKLERSIEQATDPKQIDEYTKAWGKLPDQIIKAKEESDKAIGVQSRVQGLKKQIETLLNGQVFDVDNQLLTQAQRNNFQNKAKALYSSLNNIDLISENQITKFEQLFSNILRDIEQKVAVTQNNISQKAEKNLINFVDKVDKYRSSNKTYNIVEQAQNTQGGLSIKFVDPEQITSIEKAKAAIDDFYNNLKQKSELSEQEVRDQTKVFQKLTQTLDDAVKVAIPRTSRGGAVFKALLPVDDIEFAKQEFTKLNSELEKYNAKISVSSVDARGIVKLTGVYKDQSAVVHTLKAEYDTATGALYQYNEAQKQGVTFGERLSNMLSRKAMELITYAGTSISVYKLISTLRQGIAVVKELDTAMTELRKVSEATEGSLDKFQKTSFDIARSVGSTGREIVNATADWSRLGFELADASELARVSTLYLNVAGGITEIDVATDHLISIIKAFNIEATDTIHVVDSMNEVSNNFALTASDIGEALKRSSAVLGQAGASFEESVAMITAAQEVIQNAESVGTAWRTIALRLRGAKIELQEMGEETDTMAESTAKLRKQILGLTNIDGRGGIDILTPDAKGFRNIYDIMDDIAGVWDRLEDIDQAAITELLAG